MAKSEWIIVDDSGREGNPLYHIRIGLGMFNECSHNQEEASRFTNRRDAAARLKRLRKGFRIVSAPIPAHEEKGMVA